MEVHSRMLLEEQRSHQISQANFELLLQEPKSEKEVFCVVNFALWTLKYSTRIVIVKIHDENNPFSLPEIRGRERAHQEARTRTLQDVEELKTCCLFHS